MSEAGSIGAPRPERRLWSSVLQHRTILVRGSTKPLAARRHDPVPDRAPVQLQPLGGRIQFLTSNPTPGARSERPGWDPRRPWPDVDARGRASRYWPFALKQVKGWLETPASCPIHLLLAVDGEGGTVVRYAWLIDPVGSWEFYPDDSRWGVPLGDPVAAHPALGRVLVEGKGGTEQQVLQGYAGGVRVLDPT